MTKNSKISQAAAAMGRKGGSAKSDAKTIAARENAKKPRPRARKASANPYQLAKVPLVP
jgi:hypothetical protein